jgi:hypothetical protein
MARTATIAEWTAKYQYEITLGSVLIVGNRDRPAATLAFSSASSAASNFPQFGHHPIPIRNSRREFGCKYGEEPSRLPGIAAVPLQLLNTAALFGYAPDAVGDVPLGLNYGPVHTVP